MSLKSSLLALANNIGMCQENARSIKQALAGGLADAAGDSVIVDPWTKLGTATGSGENVDIPEGLNEIYVDIMLEDTHHVFHSIIPIDLLGESAQRFQNGFYIDNSAYAYSGVEVSATSAVIQYVNVNGSNKTSTSKLTVYGR